MSHHSANSSEPVLDQDHLRTLIDALPDFVCFKDAEGRWLVVNEAGKRMFDLEDVTWLGRRDEDIADCSAIFRAALNACEIPDDQVLRGGRTLWMQERLEVSPGVFRVVDVTKVPVFESDGVPRGLLVVGRDVTELKAADRALAQSERRLDMLIQHLPGVVYQCLNDRDWTMQFISDQVETLTGYPPEAFLGNSSLSFAEIIAVQDRGAVYHTVQQALQQGRRFTIEYRIHHRNGSIRWVREQGGGTFNESGQLEALEGFITDITAEKHQDESTPTADGSAGEASAVTIDSNELEQVRAAVTASEERFRNLFNASPDAIIVESAEGRILDANEAACRLHGRPRSEIIGRTHADLVPTELRSQVERELPGESKSVSRGGLEGYYHRGDGSAIPVEIRSTRIDYEGEPALLLNIRDVSERRARELEAIGRDPLTHLPNRIMLRERLRLAIERGKRRSDFRFAVLFIDLDQFKQINDQYGHNVGDRMLKRAARRMLAVLRTTDLAARVGGDEFVVLLEDVRSLEEAVNVAERLRIQIAEPISIGQHVLHINASIGLTVTDFEKRHAHDLISDADRAMYEAKAQGGNRVVIFTRQMRDRSSNTETD